MRTAYFLPVLFDCSVAATNAVDAFKRVDRVLESRVKAQKAPVPHHERLQKRASPFLNNVTQSTTTELCVLFYH